MTPMISKRLIAVRRRGIRAGVVMTAMVMAIGALVALAAGCGSSNEPAANSSPVAQAVSVVDDAGVTIELDKPATRIVSVAPTDTELVFGAGAGSKVVGVTDYDDYPKDVLNLPKVGGFSDPSVEKIVGLKPDLVIASSGIQKSIAKRIADLGIPVATFEPTTIDGIFADMEMIGELAGTKKEAGEAIDGLKDRVERVKQAVAGLPAPTVFFEIYSKPLMTAGTETLIDDLVKTAGGVNIGAEAGSGYPQFSAEVLIRKSPQVYIAVKGSQSDPGAIATRPGYSAIAAVKDNRVFVIADNLVVRSGPRAIDGLEKIAADLHPAQ